MACRVVLFIVSFLIDLTPPAPSPPGEGEEEGSYLL
jgi:hypothetical protein